MKKYFLTTLTCVAVLFAGFVHAKTLANYDEHASQSLIEYFNQAGEDELVALPGISAKKANDIIKQRNKAEFVSLDDIVAIKGIGAKTIEKLLAEFAS